MANEVSNGCFSDSWREQPFRPTIGSWTEGDFIDSYRVAGGATLPTTPFLANYEVNGAGGTDPSSVRVADNPLEAWRRHLER